MIIPRKNLIFKDQIEAAKALYDILPVDDILRTKPLIIVPSLASVLLVDELAKMLKLNYEFLFTEKIYSPLNKDCVIGMVSETEEIVYLEELVNSFNISMDYVYGEANRKYEESILKNIYKYRKGKLIQSFQNRDILLLDEGCESGVTVLVCLKSIIGLNPKSLSYATPLIASDMVANLNSMVDQIYTVRNITNFVNVDFYYEEKIELSPQKIISILETSPYYLPLQKEGEETCVIE